MAPELRSPTRGLARYGPFAALEREMDDFFRIPKTREATGRKIAKRSA